MGDIALQHIQSQLKESNKFSGGLQDKCTITQDCAALCRFKLSGLSHLCPDLYQRCHSRCFFISCQRQMTSLTSLTGGVCRCGSCLSPTPTESRTAAVFHPVWFTVGLPSKHSTARLCVVAIYKALLPPSGQPNTPQRARHIPGGFTRAAPQSMYKIKNTNL